MHAEFQVSIKENSNNNSLIILERNCLFTGLVSSNLSLSSPRKECNWCYLGKEKGTSLD